MLTWTIALFVLLVAALAVILMVSGTTPFWSGFVLGGLVVALVAILIWVIDHGAGAQNDKFGALGEDATADVLGSRQVRRAGWKVVHNLRFDHSDVDHVVFGPAGVMAVESKWANPQWHLRGGRIEAFGRDPIEQAQYSARKIRLFLRSAGVEVHVVPVLVQWGPGGVSDEAWASRELDGVRVLRGTAWREWSKRLAAFTTQPLDGEQLAVVERALETRRQDRSLDVGAVAS
jgi:hypothetical protein